MLVRMKENKRRINYVGWLGQDNLGDEALYSAIQNIFSSYQLVPVGAGCEDHSISSPVTIIGGSTGIPEWFEWLRPTTLSCVFGAGVKDPSFFGYEYIFRNKMKVSVMIEKLRLFRYIGVRGYLSKELLMNFGIKSEVIGDPVLSLKPTENKKKDENKVAVSLGSDGILWGMDEERLFHEIAIVCRNLKKEGFEPILIPFWTQNVAAIKKIAVKERIDFFDNWLDVTSTLNLIASCKVLVGQKLHSLVFSAAAGTPFISLAYQPKCYDFTQSVGFEHYTIRTDKVTERNVLSLFADLLENYRELQGKLVQTVETYREKQKNFALRISRDINLLSDYLWMPPDRQRRMRNNVFWSADFMLHRQTALWYAWNKLFFLHMARYFT
jgi:hypothetical protein